MAAANAAANAVRAAERAVVSAGEKPTHWYATRHASSAAASLTHHAVAGMGIMPVPVQ